MSIDNNELDSFFKFPDFSIKSISGDCGKALSSQREWNHYMDVELLSKTTLISSKASSMKYSFAKKRYLGLTKITREQTVSFPFFFLALAEAHFLLSDMHGCLDALNELAVIVKNNYELRRLIGIVVKFVGTGSHTRR